MKSYTVLTTCGTVGKVKAEDLKAGDRALIEYHDENGNTIEILTTATVAEILEERELWQ